MKKSSKKYSIFYILFFFILGWLNPLSAQTNFWQAVAPPLGGNIKNFVFNQSNYIYAGVESKGIFRSSDRGKNWQLLGLNNITVTGIYINQTGDQIIIGSDKSGLFRSTDNGDSWLLINSELSNYKINCIEFYNNRLLIGTSEGLFSCNSSGGGLTRINFNSDMSEVRSIKILTPDEYIIATSSGVYRIIYENQFSLYSDGIENRNIYFLYVSEYYEIFCGSDDGIYKLNRQTNSWIRFSAVNQLSNVRTILFTQDRKIYAGDSSKIYLSSDTGKTFSPVLVLNSPVNQLGMDKFTNIYAASATGFFVLQSSNWTKTGIPQCMVINTIQSDVEGNVYAASTDGLFKADKEGKNWQQLTKQMGYVNVSAVSPDSNGFVFIATSSGIYRSSNNGQSWLKLNAGLLNFDINCLLSLKSVHLCGTKYGLFRSTDNGGNWKQIISIPSGSSVHTLIQTTQGTLLAGTSTGIYSSKDNGNSWQLKSSPVVTSDIYYIETNKSGNIIAGNFTSLYRSINDGESWSQITSGFSQGLIKNIALNPIGEIYAGTNSGIFRSVNNGASWISFNSGLLNLDIRSIRLSTAGYLFAGTNGGGLYQSALLSPTTPVLQSPANKSTNQPKSLTLRWTGSSETVLYRVQVSTNPQFTVINYEDILTNTFFNISGLQDYTTYYWRVNASNGVGESNWSDVWEFKTLMSPPNPPALTNPLNGASHVTLSPILKWSVGERTDYYEMQISESSSFSSIKYYFASIYNTEQIVDGLDELTKYYWRVRGSNIGGFGNWSPVWSFTTLSKLPYTPILLSPLNLANVEVDHKKPELTLKWYKVINADSYSLLVSTDQNFSNVFLDEKNITDTTFTIKNITSNIYYWKVKAKNGIGESSWSPTFGFIMNINSVENIDVPEGFVLNQNYPNPFNPETNITFSIANSEFVKLIIFDIHGRVVDTPVNEFLKSGKYLYRFKPNNISSGVYYYRIITKSFTTTKKMVFVR